MAIAKLLAAETFKPGGAGSSRELLEAFGSSPHLSSAAVVSVAWKVNEDQLAAVNILPSDGSKTIVIQDVLSTLAGRASRSSPGTVVTADRLEDSVERPRDLEAAGQQWGIVKMMSTGLAHPDDSQQMCGTLTLGFISSDAASTEAERALAHLAQEMMTSMPPHVDSFLEDVHCMCPFLHRPANSTVSEPENGRRCLIDTCGCGAFDAGDDNFDDEDEFPCPLCRGPMQGLMMELRPIS